MKRVKICTKCGSVNIGVPKQGIDLLNLESVCKDCGTKAVFPEIDIDEVEEFRKHLKDDK